MIYINGRIVSPDEAKISHDDRGFLLSDGLFETMRVYQGYIFCLKEHFNRLTKAANYLGIPVPFSLFELKNVIQHVLEKNNLAGKDASLRLTLTRGVGPRGLLLPNDPKPTVILTAFPLQIHAAKPITAMIVSIRRNELSPLSNIKSLAYLDNVLARSEAVKNGFDEAILLNTKGYLSEASAANIFIVKNNTLFTPKLEDGALPGITRTVIVDIVNEQNISIEEKSISVEELYLAEEIFLTNSLIEIQPVIKVNNKLISAGEIGGFTALLLDVYKNKIATLTSRR